MRPARARRSPEEAQNLILGIAEKRLERFGLDGLKLADIAAEAGITHGTILHHFGSRDGLHASLAERLVTSLVEQIIDDLRPGLSPTTRAETLGRLFSTLSTPASAGLIAYLVNNDPKDAYKASLRDRLTPLFARLIDQIAARIMTEQGCNKQSACKQARFYIMLLANAAIGDGLAGSIIRPALGLPVGPTANTRAKEDDAAHRDFIAWFVGLK